MIDRPSWIVPAVAGFGMGALALGGYQALNPQQRALDANLYMQTSAEYRAACIQAYNLATDRLKFLAPKPTDDKPNAVVMDLDETVFDNSGFQSFLDREGLTYSDELWQRWETQYPNEVRLVPGAKEFMEKADSMGVVVVLISNRLNKYKSATIDALKHLGLNAGDPDIRILLQEDTSDKTARRNRVMQMFNVALLIGDNLRDFSEDFKTLKLDFEKPEDRAKAIEVRYKTVDENAAHFAKDWIILPNPVYGEWQKPLGKDPRLNLRPSAMVKE